jgi:hypothetical protein
MKLNYRIINRRTAKNRMGHFFFHCCKCETIMSLTLVSVNVTCCNNGKKSVKWDFCNSSIVYYIVASIKKGLNQLYFIENVRNIDIYKNKTIMFT